MTVKKFLAIAFMCHQKPERSFFINGKQFPLCSRCTGILAGYFIGIILAIITKCRHNFVFPLLLIPMIADGTVQLVFKRESNNCRRFITGIGGGIGIVYIFISIHILTLRLVTVILDYLMK